MNEWSWVWWGGRPDGQQKHLDNFGEVFRFLQVFGGALQGIALAVIARAPLLL